MTFVEGMRIKQKLALLVGKAEDKKVPPSIIELYERADTEVRNAILNCNTPNKDILDVVIEANKTL